MPPHENYRIQQSCGSGIVVDLEERAEFVSPAPPQPCDSDHVAVEESIAHYCKFTFDGFSKDSQHQWQEKQRYIGKTLNKNH